MSEQSLMTETVTRALASKGDSNQQIYLELISLLQTTLAKCSSIIDVGMGQGKFLELLSTYYPNLKLAGADAADYGRFDENKIQHFIADFNQTLNIDQQFPLVTSIEVIEHLRDPRHFITELSKLCTAGGRIVVTTPNNESFSSLLSFALRGYFSAFSPRDYPAHITPVTEYQLRQIIGEHSELKIIQVYYFKNGRVPGTSLKWHRLFPFLGGKRFADNFAVVIEKN